MQDDATRTETSSQPFNLALGARLREITRGLHGNVGAEVVAALLGIPARTLENYEAGVILPAEMLLGFIAVTGANPE